LGKENFTFYLIFFFVVFFISLLQIKKAKRKEGYFLANRNLNFLLTFFTILSTSIGSSSTILLFYLISKYGFYGCFLEAGGAIGLIFLGFFFSKSLRETKAFTLPEIIGLRYGKNVRFLCSILVIISEVLWLSLIFKALQTIIFFNPFIFYILLLSFILSISIGGQWAIAKTDIFYGILIFFSFLFVYFLKNNLLNQNFSFEKMELSFAFTLFFSTFLPHLAGSDIWAKVLSSRDEKSAKAGILMAGGGKFFWAILIFLIVKKFKIIPDGDNTILNFIFSFPKLLSFLLILGLLSALLSSANSLLLTASTVFSNDLFPKFKKIKVFTFILGILSFTIALFSPDILFLFKKSYGFFSISLSIPAILSLINYKISEKILIIFMIILGTLTFFIPFNIILLTAIVFYGINYLLNFKLKE